MTAMLIPTPMEDTIDETIYSHLGANVDFYSELAFSILNQKNKLPKTGISEIKNQIYKFLNSLQTNDDIAYWKRISRLTLNHPKTKKIIKTIINSSKINEESNEKINVFLDNLRGCFKKGEYDTKSLQNFLREDPIFIEELDIFAKNWKKRYFESSEEAEFEIAFKESIKKWLALTLHININRIEDVSHIHKYRDSIACLVKTKGTKLLFVEDGFSQQVYDSNWKKYEVVTYTNLEVLDSTKGPYIQWEAIIDDDNNLKSITFIETL